MQARRHAESKGLAVTWVKIDDLMPSNPKILRASVAARWAYVASICYSGANRTDGLILADGLPLVFATPRIAQELVSVGLWEVAPDGWVVHDFLKYNRSREAQQSVEQKRSKAGSISAAKRQQRVLSGSVSVDPPDPPEVIPEDVQNQIRTNGQQSVEQNAFGDRYGTLVTALGGQLDRKTADEFEQIASDASLNEIQLGIRDCRAEGKRPYPSRVWDAIRVRRAAQEATLEDLYEPA